MRRLQQVNRLLYKEPRNFRRRNGPNAQTMVKRAPAVVSVQPINLRNATGDVGVTKLGIKDKQAWRYPGGKIVRADSTEINGRKYTDHRDGEARRKIESNFFITLNTNRTVNNISPADDAMAREACRLALTDLSRDDLMCGYFKFGPKSEHYRDDKFEDVIQKVEWQASVEVGEKLERLHCHIWLTVHHYSQVQINMPVMQNMFKRLYNAKAPSTMRANKRPYISVKLLPTSDWAMIMKQYIHKGMMAENDPQHTAVFPHVTTV